jgi:TDG/mug DNA glycosylase family protein
VLFVGINPGVRSALTGHHFAGYSNRFWKLLYESGIVPEPITSRDDARLLSWGFGITNLVARPSPGIGDLRPQDYVAGWTILRRKIRRYRPALVALVGVTLYRVILPLVDAAAPTSRRRAPALGLQPLVIDGARVFVLPNPSGRNANFSYAEMLAAFRALNAGIGRSRPGVARTPRVPRRQAGTASPTPASAAATRAGAASGAASARTRGRGWAR